MSMPFPMHGACLLCGSTTLSQVRGFDIAYLLRCTACSFVFSGRQVTEQELADYYQAYPRDATLSPITRSRYMDVCTALEKYRKSNNLLDIGCGDGHFLTVAKERGWNVYGTEYTDDAIVVCEKKGITMRKGKISNISFAPEYFDVITSFEVVEHIDDPQDEVATMSTMLRSGGCCYVTTPNFNSLSRYMLGSGWNVIGYPEHLCYFTSKTLTQLFHSSGFGLESLATTGISLDRFRAAVSRASQAPGTGMDETFRQHAEKSGLLNVAKQILNNLLNGFGAGDTLKATFQKP